MNPSCWHIVAPSPGHWSAVLTDWADAERDQWRHWNRNTWTIKIIFATEIEEKIQAFPSSKPSFLPSLLPLLSLPSPPPNPSKSREESNLGCKYCWLFTTLFVHYPFCPQPYLFTYSSFKSPLLVLSKWKALSRRMFNSDLAWKNWVMSGMCWV